MEQKKTETGDKSPTEYILSPEEASSLAALSESEEEVRAERLIDALSPKIGEQDAQALVRQIVAGTGIASFLKSLVAVGASGGRSVSRSLYHHRLALCDACPHLGSRLKTKICTKCGCIVRMKARYSAVECPVGRWPSDSASAVPPTKSSSL